MALHEFMKVQVCFLDICLLDGTVQYKLESKYDSCSVDESIFMGWGIGGVGDVAGNH